MSVVIVTYNCREAARDCLDSLYRETTDVAFETIVLDNASEDGTVGMVRSEFPDVRLIALDENVGFASGVNRAAATATGDFILLLNPDTVIHRGSVSEIVAFARSRPGHGIYGGRTLDPDGTVNPGSCWGRPTVWGFFCSATLLSTLFKRSSLFDPQSLGPWQRDSVREVDVVTGCFLLAERRVWEKLEGFDTRFFMYGEDVDLGLRAAALGHRPIFTPDAVITHEIGASSATRSDKVVLLYRGKVELVRKHFGPIRRRAAIALIWSSVAVRALASAARGRRESVWVAAWNARGLWRDGYATTAPPDGVRS